jgi:hypothetical protein
LATMRRMRSLHSSRIFRATATPSMIFAVMLDLRHYRRGGASTAPAF